MSDDYKPIPLDDAMRILLKVVPSVEKERDSEVGADGAEPDTDDGEDGLCDD